MKTWQKEALFVAFILFGTAALTHARLIEWIGSLAVIFTFMHAQIGFRFSEAAKIESGSVTCHEWSTRYFLAKEALWFSYFAMLGAWSALIGVVVFLLYPIWRKYYKQGQLVPDDFNFMADDVEALSDSLAELKTDAAFVKSHLKYYKANPSAESAEEILRLEEKLSELNEEIEYIKKTIKGYTDILSYIDTIAPAE